jgi:uroporphyrinogen III methyltransferase / synthase
MKLKGKTILTTRAASQSGSLRTKFEAVGARVIEIPTIEIRPVDDWTEVDVAISRLDEYQWLIFTSANAVDLFMARAQLMKKSITTPIAVVGSATARCVRDWGLQAAIVPKEFRAEGLLEAMPANLSGTSILFPRAEIAREMLPVELRRRGAQVDVRVVYRTVKPDPQVNALQKITASERIDCIVFTSPSAVRNLAESVDQPIAEILKSIAIAVIGPVTADAAKELGLTVGIIPEESTIDSLVVAVQQAIGNLLE